MSDIASYIYPDTRAKYAHEKIRFFLTAAKTPFYQRENDDYHAFWYSNDEAKNKFFNSRGPHFRKVFLFAACIGLHAFPGPPQGLPHLL